MKKHLSVLLFISFTCFLGAEDLGSKITAYMAKATPANNFTYKLDSEARRIIITKYIGNILEVVIPCIIEGLPVVEVEDRAFEEEWYGKHVITSLVFPDSISIIGKYCCSGCRNLKEVVLPKDLKEIPDGMFYKCESLEIVSIPPDVEKIGDSSFYECEHLKSIDIPDSVVLIETSAFEHCWWLKIVNIGKGIKCIWDAAFSRCANLNTVNINVKELNNNDFICNTYWYETGGYGKDVFSGCSSLSEKSKHRIRKTGYKDGF